MVVTITKVNGNVYQRNKKEVRKGIYIPDCFKDEAQYDRWFNETLFSGKYSFYHLRKNNAPVIQDNKNVFKKMVF